MSEAATGEEEHLSPWPILVGTGVPLLLAGLLFLPYGPIPGAILFLGGAANWISSDLRGESRSWTGDTEEANVLNLGNASIKKIAVWAFLANETVFFSSIISTSWSLRLQAHHWAAPGEVLSIPITAFNTFVLIVSSFTVVMALDSIEQGDEGKMRLYLLATLLGGILFLSIQAYEYTELWHHGLKPWAAPHDIPSVYGATFYTQTGFHGAHVFGGVLGLTYLNIKAWMGEFTQESHEAIELVGLYWHFVDVVWIFLFTIVYLI
jgi:heme/copper-type cytochrome/quinol oxidase subunit 3